MRKDELANELDTNLRNIGEYRKELEEAGYVIESTTGKYGGYRLVSGALFPVVGLRKEEHLALVEAQTYIEKHKDFLFSKDFRNAMDKVLSNTSLHKNSTGVYIETLTQGVSYHLRSFIELIGIACKDEEVVDIEYKGMQDNTFRKVRIHPYEILNDKGSYYCLAYSLKAKAYRNFKFSEERMKSVHRTELHFQRDKTFKVKEHIGQMGLMHDQLYELELYVVKESALLLSEKPVGMQVSMEGMDSQKLHYTCLMEGRIPTITFLLSLGNQVQVIQPIELRKEIAEIIEDMRTEYNSIH